MQMREQRAMQIAAPPRWRRSARRRRASVPVSRSTTRVSMPGRSRSVASAAASRSTASDVRAARREEERVPAATCSEVEDPRAGRNERGEANDPRRRSEIRVEPRAHRLAFLRAGREGGRPPGAGSSSLASSRASSSSQSTKACALRPLRGVRRADDVVGACGRVLGSRNGATSLLWRKKLSISGTRPSATPWPSSAACNHLIELIEAQRPRRLELVNADGGEPGRPVEPRETPAIVVDVQQHVAREILGTLERPRRIRARATALQTGSRRSPKSRGEPGGAIASLQ